MAKYELICWWCGEEILPTTRYIEIGEQIFCNETCEAYYKERSELE